MNKYSLGKQKTLAELCASKDEEMERLKELVYFVDQGEGGARITYKEALMGEESTARAWKAAYKTHKAEVERLKAEIVDRKNELYKCEKGEKLTIQSY